MQINEDVIVRHDGEVISGVIKEICAEEVKIELTTGESVWRKFWQVNKKQK